MNADDLERLYYAIYPELPEGCHGPMHPGLSGVCDPKDSVRRLAYADALEDANQAEQADWQRLVGKVTAGGPLPDPAFWTPYHFAVSVGLRLEVAGYPMRPISYNPHSREQISWEGRHGVKLWTAIIKKSGGWWVRKSSQRGYWIARGLTDPKELLKRLVNDFLERYESSYAAGLEKRRRNDLEQHRLRVREATGNKDAAQYVETWRMESTRLSLYREFFVKDYLPPLCIDESQVTPEFRADSDFVRAEIARLIAEFRAKYGKKETP